MSSIKSIADAKKTLSMDLMCRTLKRPVFQLQTVRISKDNFICDNKKNLGKKFRAMHYVVT